MNTAKKVGMFVLKYVVPVAVGVVVGAALVVNSDPASTISTTAQKLKL